ncbi:hypothetical protein L6164_014102 [Bauhinia variegata]|uniref:Uncharacterized protein n=1 Tax=Bauhinia variegata TaxID=167791 RepID=A0ACB9NG39_BAUVA|nr:hypothetical protein L6164_014102 [Bauhinia variegata]
MAKENYYTCLLFYCLFLSVAQFGGAVPLLGGKKLIVGIPKNKGFDQFVDVKLNSSTNQVVDVTGYSIEVFNATVNHLLQLGFNVSYEFQAFVDRTGKRAGSYDQLLQQIPARKYDVVVGDITIVANRANYVDFTLPYAESSTRMLVRVQQNQHLNMWIFLRPFSWDLWLTVVLACIFIGATLRFMERKVNRNAENESEEGSTRRRPSTAVSMLWLPLVQMVLPERESVAKNCSKFVLVVWLLLAFVLMQSYTASLSSILTLDQLQPTYPTLNDLKRNGEYVGYPTSSYVLDMMVDSFKFDKSKLKECIGIEDYREALDKGSRNGGVAAIFDEEPYIKVFLKRYGSKYYKMVGPYYRTAGFGFAFPRNSSLASYFSRAILNVIESDVMKEIEQKYFGSNEDEELQNQSNASLDSRNLTTHSFAGLFMITGFLTFLAVLVSESPTWQKPLKLAKIHSQTYLFSLLSKKTNQSEDGSMNVSSTQQPNHQEIHSISHEGLPIETLPV